MNEEKRFLFKFIPIEWVRFFSHSSPCKLEIKKGAKTRAQITTRMDFFLDDSETHDEVDKEFIRDKRVDDIFQDEFFFLRRCFIMHTYSYMKIFFSAYLLRRIVDTGPMLEV